MEVLYKLLNNRFRATKLLKDPYTGKACFYNLNSPFLNVIMLSLSKIDTNVGSNNYILKNLFRTQSGMHQCFQRL